MIDISTKARSYIKQANVELERVSDQLNTGKKINYGSQDRDIYARSLEVNADLQIYKNMQKHLGVAIAENNMTDKIVSNIKDNLNTFKSKLLQASTDTTSPDGRAILAKELEHLRDNIVDLGNAKMYGEYLFAGRDSTKAPFEFTKDANGHYENVKYVGDNEHREVVVDKGIYKDRGLNGIELFSGAKGSANEGIDLIVKLNDAIAAVKNNDRDDMATKLDIIAEDGFNNLNNAHSELGLRNEFFEKSESRVNARVVHFSKLEQEVVGVDVAEASIRLRELELMYNAMYSSIAKINNLSLVNYMK